MRTIGITGGVGAGKTRLLEYIEKNYNCYIILADEVAHRLQEPGRECYDKLRALFCEAILTPEGEIDRAKLAEEIFADDELRRKVNAIVHPAVKAYIVGEIEEKKAQGGLDFLFIEAALLIEDGYDELVDELWYVHSDIGIRRKRLKSSRLYTDEKIDAIMKKQLSEEEFKKRCSVIIDNGGDLEAAFRQLDEKLEEYLCQKQ